MSTPYEDVSDDDDIIIIEDIDLSELEPEQQESLRILASQIFGVDQQRVSAKKQGSNPSENHHEHMASSVPSTAPPEKPGE